MFWDEKEYEEYEEYEEYAEAIMQYLPVDPCLQVHNLQQTARSAHLQAVTDTSH